MDVRRLDGEALPGAVRQRAAPLKRFEKTQEILLVNGVRSARRTAACKAGQGGAYHFCDGPAPAFVEAIRTTLYAALRRNWPEGVSESRKLALFSLR